MAKKHLVTASILLCGLFSATAFCAPSVSTTNLYTTTSPQTIADSAGNLYYECIQSKTNLSLFSWYALPSDAAMPAPTGYQYPEYSYTTDPNKNDILVTAPPTEPCDSSTVIYGTTTPFGNGKHEHSAAYSAAVTLHEEKGSTTIVFSNGSCDKSNSTCSAPFTATLAHVTDTASGNATVSNITCSNNNTCTGVACLDATNSSDHFNPAGQMAVEIDAPNGGDHPKLCATISVTQE
ncbi:MAG: hypothetical protein V4496_05325 [Pseudomonadota bacterium]